MVLINENYCELLHQIFSSSPEQNIRYSFELAQANLFCFTSDKLIRRIYSHSIDF